jgi:hypothetical protein
VAYCEIAYEKGWTKSTNRCSGPLGITCHPKGKVNVTAECLETQFLSHDLSEEYHEGRMKTGVQALLASVDDTSQGKVRPRGVHKLTNILKLRQASKLVGIPNESLGHLPRRPLVYLPHLFNHCLRLSHFPKPWKKVKVITLPNPGKDPKFPQHLRPISLLSTTGKLSEKVIPKIESKDALK